MPGVTTLRAAARTIVRRPTVTAVALASLAIGIGLNSAVFSVVDALFLRPPAVHDPYSLIHIEGQFKDSGMAVLDWSDCQDIASQTPAFSGATAFMRRGGLWRDGDEMTLLMVTVVADNYFDLLGVRPVLGNLPDQNRNYAADPEPPIVLAHWFWQQHMGRRSDIIGHVMELSGHLYRVAAVLPTEFRGLEPSGSRHIWVPVGSWTRYMTHDLQRGSGQFEGLARLKPRATLDVAQAQLDALSRRIEASDSRVPKGRRLVAESIGTQIRSRFMPGVLVLAVVSLVLLIACANVAAVLLAQADARRREIGIRLALGAGPAAMLRQFLAESAILAVSGMAVGLLLARWLLSLAPALAPPSPVPTSFDLRMDVRLLLFTAAASLVTLVLFSLAPLFYSTRVSVLDALTSARVAGRNRRSVIRFGFVAAQVALGMVMVSGAVVLVRALSDARALYPGYDTNRPLALLWSHLVPEASKRPEPVLYSEAVERIASVSGVEAVTYARHLPLVGSGAGASISVVPQGFAPDAVPMQVYFNLVGPRFFEVTGARITRGRAFQDADHYGGLPVAIVNAEAARRFWPGQNPIGKTVRANKDSFQVVGVAADGRISGIHEEVRPVIMLPASRMNWGETIFVASTAPDPASVVKQLAKAAARTGEIRVYESGTLRSLMQEALYEDWVPTVLGGGLAGVGLLLAAGGLYGAVSYASQRRLREFGVRMAIGARAGQIAGLVLRQAALICAIGIPAGAILFGAVYRYYGATLLRNRPFDVVALIAGAAVATAVVLTAAVWPAVRASQLDASEVLRSD